MRKFVLDEDIKLDLGKKDREREQRTKDTPVLKRLLAALFGGGAAAGLSHITAKANGSGSNIIDGRLLVTPDIPDELLLKAMEESND